MELGARAVPKYRASKKSSLPEYRYVEYGTSGPKWVLSLVFLVSGTSYNASYETLFALVSFDSTLPESKVIQNWCKRGLVRSFVWGFTPRKTCHHQDQFGIIQNFQKFLVFFGIMVFWSDSRAKWRKISSSRALASCRLLDEQVLGSLTVHKQGIPSTIPSLVDRTSQGIFYIHSMSI